MMFLLCVWILRAELRNAGWPKVLRSMSLRIPKFKFQLSIHIFFNAILYLYCERENMTRRYPLSALKSEQKGQGRCNTGTKILVQDPADAVKTVKKALRVAD